MIKKTLVLLITACLLCGLCPAALAGEDAIGLAEDITARCQLSVSNTQRDLPNMTDNDYATYWKSSHRGYVEVAAPQGEKLYGLYVSWAHFITTWCVQAPDETGAWQDVYATQDAYYNQYIPLTRGYERVRIQCLSPDYDHWVHVAELRVLGAGAPPAWVQQWKTLEGKADLVLLVTDPGDEYLFFGGMIPYYVAQGREVMLCVVVNTAAAYKNQLLDGLWYCGMTNYPYIAYFKPNMAMTRRQQYDNWGELQFVRHVTRIVRIYQPDVMVTHALDGEGVDGGHRVCADASIRAIRAAVDDTYDVGYSLKLWGNWPLKKLYLHLHEENPVTLDWSQPLDFFDGKSAWQVAAEAYAMQDYQSRRARELPVDGIYDGTAFGLYYSAVGLDAACDDLFENIE